jgi:3-deoxy-D-manno-octulosonic-acid transferase
MARVLYSLLLRLALPAQVLRHVWRGWRSPQHRGSLRAHLALGLQARTDRPLWLHAASVGEVQGLSPLVRELRRALPGLPLLITVGTATGLARARQHFAASSDHAVTAAQLTVMAAPWDLPGAARRFVASQRPCAAVFIETELWPNLLREASVADVALLLASARVSEASTRRYRRWASGLMCDTVRRFSRIGAQSMADRERFMLLGAEPGAVECWGNLKFDFVPPPGVAEQGRAMRARLAPDRSMWVAGSTHAGEEMACLQAQSLLRETAAAHGMAAPLLVIAPRRPERFEEVARLVVGSGASLQRHSTLAPGRESDVLLVDELGALLPYYAAADVTFVGGSLVPVGGHNLLEPAALARPVLAGPHTGNAPDVARLLEGAGGLARVRDAGELAATLLELLGNPAQARRAGEAAAAVVAANGGATTRALEAITAVLRARQEQQAPGGPTARSASG